MARSSPPSRPLATPAQQSAPPMPPAMPSALMPQRKVTLLEAIAAASAGFGDLTKDSKNEYLKSSYLKLPGLLKAIKPALLEQGIVIYSQCVLAGSLCVIRTTLSFVDGSEEISSDFPIPDATNLQRIGAAFTYGTRYNLFALLAVSPDEDDDGNYGATAAPAAAGVALPGLSGGAGAWPAPGQQVVAPQAMYQQLPQIAPQTAQWPMAAPAQMPVNPVQPLPVLQ